MNYSKWDNIDSDSDDGFTETYESWERFKANTDRLMENSHINVALRGYLEILKNISEFQKKHMMLDIRTNQLIVSCRLGAACCFLKLSDWKEALSLCETTLKAHKSELSSIQCTRALYFKAVSLFNISKGDDVDPSTIKEAKFACDELIKSVVNNPKETPTKVLQEYRGLQMDIEKYYNSIHDINLGTDEEKEEDEADIFLEKALKYCPELSLEADSRAKCDKITVLFRAATESFKTGCFEDSLAFYEHISEFCDCTYGSGSFQRCLQTESKSTTPASTASSILLTTADKTKDDEIYELDSEGNMILIQSEDVRSKKEKREELLGENRLEVRASIAIGKFHCYIIFLSLYPVCAVSLHCSVLLIQL